MNNTSKFFKQFTVAMIFLFIGTVFVGVLAGCGDDNAVESDEDSLMSWDGFWDAIGVDPNGDQIVSMQKAEFFDKVGKPKQINEDQDVAELIYRTKEGVIITIRASAESWNSDEVYFSTADVISIKI